MVHRLTELEKTEVTQYKGYRQCSELYPLSCFADTALHQVEEVNCMLSTSIQIPDWLEAEG